MDNAGNTSTPVTIGSINIDKTAPTVSGGRTPAANANGWNNTNITVTFTGTDTLSGLASCTPSVVKSSEGADQSATGTCTDNAGNTSAPVTVSNINIDKTAPTLTGSKNPAANANGWNNS